MTSTAVTERTIDLDGRRYAYHDTGDASLPALLAIHGLVTHAGIWDEFARGLSDVRRVVAFDLRGHGGSDWTSSYSQADWVDDVRLIADALELQRFALIGHTMGARIAWFYAAQNPERVERLVILDSSPFKPSNFPPAPADGFATLDDAVAAAREERFAETRESLFRPFAERSVGRHADGRWYWRLDPRLRSAPTDQPDFAASVDEQWAALRRVTCPVLILTTARNPRAARDAEDRVKMVREMPNAHQTDLAGVGHAALLEKPEVVVDATRDFLS